MRASVWAVPGRVIGVPPQSLEDQMQPQQVHYVGPQAKEDCSQALGFNVVYPVRFWPYWFWNRNVYSAPAPPLSLQSTPQFAWFHRFAAREQFASGWRVYDSWMRLDLDFYLILWKGKASGATGMEWVCFTYRKRHEFWGSRGRMLWSKCLCFPKSCVKILMPDVMVLVGRAFSGCLNHERGALITQICAF